jgi:starvation-inducible DNA-binding protein
MLNKLLCDLSILYQKQRNYHWNVTGKDFIAIHTFLEKEYDAFAEFIDETAELIRMKGETPYATYKEYLDNTQFKEGDSSFSKEDMLKDIISDYETLLKTISSVSTDDRSIDDLYVGLTKHLEKSLWFMKMEAN